MNELLPVIFLSLMGLAMLAYVVLDGYDLGVGMLLRRASPHDKDHMIAAIGPFWDANETWLVLGIGLLLVAFPKAHGMILGALYLPVTIMLIGLVLRGVAFDFRYKAKADHRARWDRLFYAGSLITAGAQGFMLGHYITGFAHTVSAYAFALLITLCLISGYLLIGATWLIIKTDGALQRKAIDWALGSFWGMVTGIAAISIATPLVSPSIFAKWFELPAVIALLPIPLCTAAACWLIRSSLQQLALESDQRSVGDRLSKLPFLATSAVFVLAFFGLAYSLFPYLIIDQIDIYQAASAPESLRVILVGAAVTLPMIIGYHVFVYRVFAGKAEPLV